MRNNFKGERFILVHSFRGCSLWFMSSIWTRGKAECHGSEEEETVHLIAVRKKGKRKGPGKGTSFRES
jgi:hypothetical protein